MLAPSLKRHSVAHTVQGETPQTLARIPYDEVNLAIWQRQLPLHINDFGQLLLSLNVPLAESLVVELPSDDAEPNLHGLAAGFSDLHGYEGFIADVSWLVSAFACLLGAKGENWHGNEGFGLIHRSPQPTLGERRLILTLDWLG